MTLQPILNAAPVVQAHIAFALASVLLGIVVLSLRKGTWLHKMLGRTWGAAMSSVAIGSFWIKSSGNFSWIHILSVIVLLNLAAAIYFIRHKNVRAHRGFMIGNFIGLVVAGAFTLMPHRILGQALFGA